MDIVGLNAYATPRQREILAALLSEGSGSKAAAKLGMSKSAVNEARRSVINKAAQRGYSPDHGINHPVPDGFKLKGTSTLYDSVTGEAKIQWVKSTADQVRQDEIFREALEAMAEALPRAEPIKAPEFLDDSLAACYPVGDHHLGMLAWAEEAGEDYNISIGKKLLMGAMDHLVKSSPDCKTGLIALLGDFMHYDSFEAVTPAHRNLLDADGRFPKMVRAAIKSVRYMIAKCLEKHEVVHVIIEIGNHDTASSVFLMECLHNIYEDEPRITIDRSPGHYHYWRFGKCLIGTHHGDKVKSEKLPLIMATDRAVDWGETEYRYWWTGHIHHESKKDYTGCSAESFRVLCPSDAYAANAGYRTGRDMKAIILHKEYGEVARHVVNPRMLEARLAPINTQLQ
jgi:hypothetical protein